MLAWLTLAAGTFVSEDLTCISAGLLVQRGVMNPVAAISACAVGILVGDVGLWAIGRVFGTAAFSWPWVARHLRTRGVEQLREWLQAHAAVAILSSRFVPGARLPLYVVAGVAGLPGSRFACWASVAALLWTPVLVLGTAMLGDVVSTRAFAAATTSWTPALAAGAITALAASGWRRVTS